MKECACQQPVRNPAPAQRTKCVKCSKHIHPRWSPSDKSLNEFFSSLGDIFEDDPNELAEVPNRPPDWFFAFRDACLARERAGRDYFGFRFMERNNVLEAVEEACDLAIYCELDGLRARRDGNPDDDRDLRLTAAFHAAKAYRALLDLRARQLGAP